MTSPSQHPHTARDPLTAVLAALAFLLLVPASLLLFIALAVGLSGDGFTDAAPWWLFILLLAVAMGAPGLLLLLIVRRRRRTRRVANVC